MRVPFPTLRIGRTGAYGRWHVLDTNMASVCGKTSGPYNQTFTPYRAKGPNVFAWGAEWCLDCKEALK